MDKTDKGWEGKRVIEGEIICLKSHGRSVPELEIEPRFLDSALVTRP